jgi:hypothetical protein
MALGTALLCASLLAMAYAAPNIAPSPVATRERCKAYDAASGSGHGPSFSARFYLYGMPFA